MVDILREEGMGNGNPDVVVSVVTQAIRDSFTLVLDNIVDGEVHTIALSKQLASSFLIRGAQFSVVRRIDSQYIVQIQTNLLTWIGKRLATYENNKNKKSRKIAITFFRVLIPTLVTLDNRDALKITYRPDFGTSEGRSSGDFETVGIPYDHEPPIFMNSNVEINVLA